MAVNVNTGFDDKDFLRDIRTVVLNPVAVKVAGLESTVQTMKTDMGHMFQGATAVPGDKTIIFHQHNGNDAVADLDGMFQEGSDLELVDDNGTSYKKVAKVHYPETTVHQTAPGEVEVHYKWGDIVPAHQENLSIGKTGTITTHKPKALYFKGESVKVEHDGMFTTVEVPKIPLQLTASIPGGDPAITIPVPINTIELEGTTSKSVLKDGKLTIHLNEGGGVADDNFKGFFASLGDLISKVSDPKNGKTYAFVQDTQYGGFYYTPYFYVNDGWKELKQDPALTYSNTTSATTQGVFSIKPSSMITVDQNGQLNLDGLSTPQLPSHFKGFFSDIEELKRAVPNPVLHQDWAYVRNQSTGGLIGYRADIQGSARLWNPIAPLGSIAVIDRTTSPHSYAQAFGIEKNGYWNVDSKGILSLKPIDTKTDIIISDQAGSTTGGEINKIKFVTGKSYAEVSGEELIINHPQQVINYNSTWEQAHTSRDYEGNIFYDETSRTWMGWGIPSTPGGVDRKWTKVFHSGMSDEVKDLSKRLPAKTASVQPGVLDDHPSWSYNGITYLESDSDQLPEDLKNSCGGYITTSVQDKDAPNVTIAQHRIQTCVADRIEGGTWVRRYIGAGSPGASVEWSPWVRTSFSYKDIEAHQKDLGAHKEAIKYYKVVSLLGNIKGILSQTTGGALGGFHADNRVPVTDSYGYTPNADLDYISTPYSGDFRLKGFLSFSGYKDGTKKYPLGSWQIVFRKKDTDTQNYAPVGQLRYDHTDSTKPFPVISFLVDSFKLDTGQELIINLTFSDAQGISNGHPDLYIVPSRSFLSLEDTTTKAGSGIARSMRLLFGNIDTIGDVAIKSHHSTLTDPNSQIRVYGEKVNKTPVEMVKIS